MVRFAMMLASTVEWFMDKFMNWFLEAIVSRIDKRYHIREQPFTGPTSLVAGSTFLWMCRRHCSNPPRPASACAPNTAGSSGTRTSSAWPSRAAKPSSTRRLSRSSTSSSNCGPFTREGGESALSRLQASLAAVLPELEEEHRGIVAAGAGCGICWKCRRKLATSSGWPTFERVPARRWT